jgi:hypothetical protein
MPGRVVRNGRLNFERVPALRDELDEFAPSCIALVRPGLRRPQGLEPMPWRNRQPDCQACAKVCQSKLCSLHVLICARPVRFDKEGRNLRELRELSEHPHIGQMHWPSLPPSGPSPGEVCPRPVPIRAGAWRRESARSWINRGCSREGSAMMTEGEKATCRMLIKVHLRLAKRTDNAHIREDHTLQARQLQTQLEDNRRRQL